MMKLHNLKWKMPNPGLKSRLNPSFGFEKVWSFKLGVCGLALYGEGVNVYVNVKQVSRIFRQSVVAMVYFN